jgi:RNA polymerase sigma-70 factor (ECF subfamily)
MSRDPDEYLWRQAQQGDHAAFDKLHHKYRPLVRGEIRKRLQFLNEEDLQDIDVQIWAATWSALPRFQGISTFCTWLGGIAKNQIFTWLRNKNREKQKEAIAEYSEELTQGSPENEVVVTTTLVSALKKLPPPERIALYYRYYEQLKDEEIAQCLKVPLGTIKSRLRAGLIKLRKDLSPEEEERDP